MRAGNFVNCDGSNSGMMAIEKGKEGSRGRKERKEEKRKEKERRKERDHWMLAWIQSCRIVKMDGGPS